MFKTMFRLLAVIVCVSLSGLSVHAREIAPPPGWALIEHMDKAIEHAQENNLPMVFVHTNRVYNISSCPRCVQAVRSATAHRFLRHGPFNSMVSMVVYQNENSPEFRKVQQQVADRGQGFPRLYITDPDLNVIAFVAADDERRALNTAITNTVQFMSWRNGVSRRVEQAQAMARRGQLHQALTAIQRIAQEDSEVTTRLDAMLRNTSQQQTQGTSDAQQNEQQLAPGRFFPGIVDEGSVAVQKIADEVLEEARKAMEEGDWVTARRLLTVMARDQSDMPQVARAQQLLEQVQAAQSEARAQQ